MDTNDSLQVASLWHSMHAISQQLTPSTGCTGNELLEADTFDLHCFQSLAGLCTVNDFLSIIFALVVILCHPCIIMVMIVNVL